MDRRPCHNDRKILDEEGTRLERMACIRDLGTLSIGWITIEIVVVTVVVVVYEVHAKTSRTYFRLRTLR